MVLMLQKAALQILILLCCTFAAAPQTSGSGHSAVKGGQITRTATPSPFDAEAKSIADQYWDGVFTICGKSYYYAKAAELAGPKGMDLWRGRIYQIDGGVRRDPPAAKTLSPADKANGIQWDGTADARFSGIIREANVQRADGSGRYDFHALGDWGGWIDVEHLYSGLRLDLTRQNGSWSWSYSGEWILFKMSCEVITRNPLRSQGAVPGEQVFLPPPAPPELKGVEVHPRR